MRRLLFALLACLLVQAAPGQESIMLSHAEPLRFAFGLELLGSRIEAIRIGGELEVEAGEEERAADADAGANRDAEDEVAVRPLDLFAGTLSERAPDVHERLVAALEELERAAARADRAGLDSAAASAAELLEAAEEVLVSNDLRLDPAFRAAVLARLALSGSGFAEGYEEAAGGEVGAYVFGWAGLQRAKTLWAELEPAAQSQAGVAEVERAFAVLDELMPTPEPPERFRDPEDAEVAAHDLVFGLEASFGSQLQARDLAAVLALVDEEGRAACRAFEEDRGLLALELVTSARVTFVEGVGGTIGLLAPGPAEEIRELLGETLRERIEEGAASAVRDDCTRLQSALSEAATVFR
jgi:hypothetical protein